MGSNFLATPKQPGCYKGKEKLKKKVWELSFEHEKYSASRDW